MNRRNFIKLSSTTLVATMILPSLTLSNSYPKNNSNYPRNEIILYNTDDGRFYSLGNKRMNVLDLHRKLCDMSDECELYGDNELSIIDIEPTVRHTDTMFSLQDPWRLTEDSMKLLYGGSIQQGDDVYTAFLLLGYENDIEETEIIVNNKTIEHIDFLHNIEKGEIITRMPPTLFHKCSEYNVIDFIGMRGKKPIGRYAFVTPRHTF